MRYFTSEIGISENIEISVVGNKAYNLHRLMLLNIAKVPLSIVLNMSDDGYSDGAIRELIGEVDRLFRYPIIARSSSSVEDSDHSFAGQFLSLKCNNDIELKENVTQIAKSAHSENVVAYCHYHGIDVSSINMAILVQQYLSPQIAGVLFTRNPNRKNDNIYIEYKQNDSSAITSGDSRGIPLELPKSMHIDNVYFEQLRDIAIAAENSFGYPLDIEWIVAEDKLWIVQIRKITA